MAAHNYCQNCGAAITAAAEICVKCGARVSGVPSSAASDKSRLAVTLLAFFLGELGIHRFYLGKIGTGLAMLFTLGGFGIWALIDFIMAVAGVMKDKEGKPIVNW